jgi:SAM-dependent methyltransferase
MNNYMDADAFLWKRFYGPSFQNILDVEIDEIPQLGSFFDLLEAEHLTRRDEILDRLKKYQEKSSPLHRFSLFNKHFESPPKRSLKVLDFGCGQGHFSRFLAQKFWGEASVVGYDVEIPQNPSSLKNLTFTSNWGEVEQFGCFDLVVIFFVLHHIKKSEQARWMDAVRGILASGAEVWILEDISSSDEVILGGRSFDYRELYLRNEYWSNEWTYGVQMEIHPSSYLRVEEVEEFFPKSSGFATFLGQHSQLPKRLHPLPFTAFQLRV